MADPSRTVLSAGRAQKCVARQDRSATPKVWARGCAKVVGEGQIEDKRQCLWHAEQSQRELARGLSRGAMVNMRGRRLSSPPLWSSRLTNPISLESLFSDPAFPGQCP